MRAARYSWLPPHLSDRAAERLYKFLLSYGDYLSAVLVSEAIFF